jgi:hypothetical protein
MSVHTYPMTAVIGDYTRTVLGLAVSIVPFYAAPAKPLVTYIFAGMLAAFVIYGLRTLARHLTRVEISDEGIRTNMPSARAIAWGDVEKVRLRFFATKRKRADGWFQLVLAGAGRSIVIESSIRDFHDVVARAAAAAARNRLTLDDATAGNLEALTQTAGPSPS